MPHVDSCCASWRQSRLASIDVALGTQLLCSSELAAAAVFLPGVELVAGLLQLQLLCAVRVLHWLPAACLLGQAEANV